MCTPLEIVEKAIESFNEDESGLHLIKHNLSDLFAHILHIM